MIFRFICVVSFLMISAFASEKNVLLIHSFSKGTNWTDGISKGIESILDKSSNINLSTEYIDIEMHSDEYYNDLLLSFYKERFSKINYDVVILADNFAVAFITKNKKILFKNDIPIVLCGLENNVLKYTKMYKNKKINIVFENLNYKQNFDLIENIFPKLETIYFIHDDFYTNYDINHEKEKAINEFSKKYKIVREKDIDLNFMSMKINKLPKNSVVLIGNFSINNNKKIISNYKKELFLKSIDKPIFIVSDEELNKYTIGGYLLSSFEQGKKSAELAIQLLSGIKSKDLPFITIPDTRAMFNYLMLKKNEISFSRLPKNSILINKPKSFIEKNEKLVKYLLTILPIVIFLLIGLIFNIKIRKKLEKKLDIQNRFDKILLENVGKIVFWCNDKKEVIKCNNSFCKMLNKSEKDIIGKNVKNLIPVIYKKISINNSLYINEIEVLCEIDKKSFWYQVIQHNLKSDKKNFGLITIMQDITENKKNEEERVRSEQFLIQQSKQAEVGEMITAIAHQWKLPLLEISTIVQTMLLRYKRKEITEEKINSFVDSIMSYIISMGEIIDDFRDFIKPSKNITQFEIKKTVEDSIKIIQTTLNYNYINISLCSKSEKNIYISGYENEFKQTIINIINNSKDAIVEARCENKECGNIEVTLNSLDSNKIEINIMDDGKGFSEESLEKAFDPFFSTKDKNIGDGFGLYMSRLIIEDKMRGQIFINDNNMGANISIYLPTCKEQKEIV